jgi:MEMO1 family protein
MGGIVFTCLTPHPPLIIPDIGKGEERAITNTIQSMETLVEYMARYNPETCLIISPHGNYQSDAMGILTAPASNGDLSTWGVRTPTQYFDNDLDLVDLIQKESKQEGVLLKSIGEKYYILDHGVMVPMYFLGRALKGVPLVPLTFSWLSLMMHFSFGKAIQKAVNKSGKRVAVIASGDMSHRLIPGAPAGFDPKGIEFDKKIAGYLAAMDTKSILNMDEYLIDRAGECGLRSIVIMLGMLDGLKVKPSVLSYEGPFGVGYLVASFEVIQ